MNDCADEKLSWGNQGIFCLSIDLELAWGFADQVKPELIDLAQRLERPIIQRLLQLFENYQIPASWLMVGRLLEKGDFPVANSPESVWYAPEVIEMIKKAKPVQEIGSHSFAHIYFSKLPAEQARRDLEHARRVHRENGLEFISFVYPRHMVGYTDFLPEYGIKVIRGGPSAERLAGFGRVGRFGDKLLPIAPKTVCPIIHPNGLIELPGSLYLMGRNGIRRLISPRIFLTKVQKGLLKAVKEKSLFHFWFHPSNFYFHTETQFGILEEILKMVTRLREQGGLQVLRMKDFVNLLRDTKLKS